MKYFDADENEISYEDIDLDKGYLTVYNVLKEHHEAIEAVPEEYHFEVRKVFLTDGGTIIITSQDDPRLIINDVVKADFDFDDGTGRTVEGFDYRKVVDKEGVLGHDAYDERVDYQQYILYTEEELAEKAAEKEKQENRQQFLDNGYERMDNVEVSLDDLTLAVADMIGA